MRITRIENQRRRPGRKNIYVDGRFLAGVSAETLLRLALRTGDEIGPEQLTALQRTEEYLNAKNTALRFLSVRPRSIREVRDRLREREFPDSEITRVIADLSAAGLLNDDTFARAYIRNAIALRPTGELLLRRKLILLGVSRESVEAALQEEFGSIDREAEALRAARAYLKRRGSRGTTRSDPRIRQRLASLLGRRGYAWDVIEPVLRKALGTEEV